MFNNAIRGVFYAGSRACCLLCALFWLHLHPRFLTRASISGIICSGVIALKGGGGNLVLHQLFSTLRLCYVGWGVVEHAILNEHIFAVNVGNWHHDAISAAFCHIAHRNHSIGITVNRQLEIAVQLCFRGTATPLLRTAVAEILTPIVLRLVKRRSLRKYAVVNIFLPSFMCS